MDMDLRTRLYATIIALALAVLASPAVSSAAPKPAPSTASSDDFSSQQAFTVNGRISSVDYTSNVIVVQNKHNSTSIVLTPTTSVDLSGQQGGISDLRPGMHVRVRGTVVGGVMTAESIVVNR
jgi:hypothetical protein